MSTPPPELTDHPQPPPRGPGIYLDSIRQAYRLVTDEWLTWVVTSFLFFIFTIGLFVVWSISFSLLTINDFDPSRPVMSPKILTVFFFTGSGYAYLAISFLGGMVEMALRQIRSEPILSRMIFLGFRNPLNAFVALLVALVGIFMGLTLLVPSFFLMGALAFAPYLPSIRNLDAMDALKQSFAVLWRHGFAMFFFLILVTAVSLSGLLACFVGVLITLPILPMVLAIHYNLFFPKSTEDFLYQPLAETPPT